MAVLGDSEAFKDNFIEGLCNEPEKLRVYPERRGIKARQIKSEFNKVTQKTEGWQESESDSSELMTIVRNAVRSHIHSVQHGDSAKREVETLQQSHSVGKKSSTTTSESSTTTSESNKTQKQCLSESIVYNPPTPEKEFAAQFEKPDNETLCFLYRNAQSKETPDNNIPYSINLWEFDIQDEFSAMNHLFLKAEALIVYIMDLNLDLFSSIEQIGNDENTNKSKKSPAKILSYWLNSIHMEAKKQNLKPNIVLVLTHTSSIKAAEQNLCIESYIKNIMNMVEGKSYAPYISKENIIPVDNCQKSLKAVRGKLFDRITMQPTWGVKKPIRWLQLEAELLSRTTYKEKSYLHTHDDDDHYIRYDHADREQHLLISQVKVLASTYGMDDCEMDSFLEFHHVLGDFICCPPSELGRFIIIHPQWLLNKFSQLLAYVSHTHRQDEPVHYRHRHKLLHFPRPQSKAIISMEYLHEVWGLEHSQLLSNLMMDFHFILPLDCDNYWCQRYLIPCMLPLEDSYIHETELTYSAVHIAQELEFHRLLCLCAKQSNWKLSITVHLSNHHASFDINLGTHLVLNRKSNNTIEVSTWTSIQELDKGQNDDIRAFLLDIHKEMARKMETLGVPQSKVFRMLCPHRRPGDGCLCLVEIEEQTGKQPDDFVFHPISDRCAIHKKTLKSSLFSSTGTCQQRKVVPLLDKVIGKYHNIIC